MKQDLRALFEKERDQNRPSLADGHQERFAQLLEEKLPQKKKSSSFRYWMAAASVAVLLGVAGLLYQPSSDGSAGVVDVPSQIEKGEGVPVKEFELQEVAPEFKKIENFYLASLNIELASLDVNDRNREIVDSFMKQLAGLDQEYQLLNEELYQYGANSQTLEAMVRNLQFRLELLLQVKKRIENNKHKMKDRYEDVRI